jgi:predicted TIM-barrel fold metal-dependent hydrolase
MICIKTDIPQEIYDIDDEFMYPIYAKCVELDVPIFSCETLKE